MSKLDDARKNINIIDKQMAELFEERMKQVEDVVSYKQENDLPVLDVSREKALLGNNLANIKEEKYKEYYRNFLKDVMELSKTYQRRMINEDKVGYQGVEGAFSFIATNTLFPDAKKYNYINFEDVFKAVYDGEIKYGVIPFENSYTGEVGEVTDLLHNYDVYIHDIYYQEITQNLLGIKGSTIRDVKTVYSHPQALAQCAKFFKGRDIKLIEYKNTAMAADYVAECNDKSKAAIASLETASIYDLEVLQPGIQTSNDNMTRFIVIGKELKDDGDHFQMQFTTENKAGALATAMDIISKYGFNMESIQSRAIPNRSWEYYFSIEVDGCLKDTKTTEMLKKLQERCTEVRILGSYNK